MQLRSGDLLTSYRALLDILRYPAWTDCVDEAAVNADWPNAWWLIGEASDWVLKFAETNSADRFTDAHMIQFLHFVTNGLCIGGLSVFAGTRF